ncbi:unnamed protein product [Gadus morhua 'NCC']
MSATVHAGVGRAAGTLVHLGTDGRGSSGSWLLIGVAGRTSRREDGGTSSLMLSSRSCGRGVPGEKPRRVQNSGRVMFVRSHLLIDLYDLQPLRPPPHPSLDHISMTSPPRASPGPPRGSRSR